MYDKEICKSTTNLETKGVLRPCKEESVNFDETENLYIEGDNLEVLKLLQKSYFGKIKMIYIDPPYNTGKDFVYKDNFKDNLQNYLELTGQVDGEGKNQKTAGRCHSNWLNMMYPRLYIARQLLRDDGVIFISIDDNEVHNLRKLCDEIFGEENFIRNVIWEKKYSPSNDSKVISDTHDHILVYSKNIYIWKLKLLPRTKEMNDRYTNMDNDPRGNWKPGGLSAKTYNEKYDFSIETPSGKIVYPPTGSCWQVSQDRLKELIKDNRIYFGKNNDSKPQIKQFLTEVQDGYIPKSLWKKEEVGHNQISRKELTNLFNGVFPFDNPKPTKLIKRCLEISVDKEDIILDFFSGSATTAHAVMQLNAEDGGNRKYIMVQLPEPTDENKAGYKNICEIGKERIRRAGNKILEELKLGEEQKDIKLDIGFKVLKLRNNQLHKKIY